MYACIDLGSNSFHLLIGEWEAGRIRIIERCSERVQLGAAVGSSGVISTAAFARGLLCLQHFKILMDQYPLQQYWALGTNTFRVTANADDFIVSAKKIGVDISIISGVQEAVLIYAGVITMLPLADAHRLVIDIGGGSTEVIVGKMHARLLTESLPIGSVAWRDQFFNNDLAQVPELEQRMDAAATAAKQVFDGFAPAIRNLGWSEPYASSGTVKMLAAICEYEGYGIARISLQALQELKTKLAACIANCTELAVVKERRRDLLLPGWSVLVGLMQSYGIESIEFSATALREGMLDFMVKNEKTLEAMAQSNLPDVSYANK
jgi:exopolyphosphatase/guanosine-5'-triphosphate,3'-diphosphate pyrophosphatase